ncbi:MAG: hypothetical protein NT027_09380 [Proteobacteria bacterium]|nr:hypothetical protein [Pseudomonadota bacterium]
MLKNRYYLLINQFLISLTVFFVGIEFALGQQAKPAGQEAKPVAPAPIEKFEIPKLEIIVPTNDDEGSSKKSSAKALNACKKFAKYFQKNSGIWATGPFSEVKCTASGSKSKVDVSSYQWVMKTERNSDDTAIFEIFFRRGSTMISQAKLELENSMPVVPLMQQSKLGREIAAYLSISLPMRSYITKADLKVGHSISSKVENIGSHLPPKNLTIFTATLKDDVWMTTVYGSMVLKEGSSKKATWQVSAISALPIENDVYLVQQTEDRTPLLEDLKNIIVDKNSSFFNKLFRVGRSAYIGFRYGIPLKAENSLITKSPSIGLLGEFRSGILKGFRFNYDMTPKSKLKTDAGVESYETSRLQLGYAFGKQLDWPVIHWVDLTPRLGITNIEYKNELYQSDGEETSTSASFTQRRAPTTALEIGAESRHQFFLARAWLSQTFSIGVVKLDKNFKTNTFKFGLDLYKDLIKLKSMRITGLGFYSFDKTTITNTQKEESDQVEIESLSLGVSYLGFGLTLSW